MLRDYRPQRELEAPDVTVLVRRNHLLQPAQELVARLRPVAFLTGAFRKAEIGGPYPYLSLA